MNLSQKIIFSLLPLFALFAGCTSKVDPPEVVKDVVPSEQDRTEELPPAWMAALRPPPDTSCDVSTKSPDLLRLVRSSRPPGMESLDFYQTLSVYSAEDQSKLTGRLMYADDCPADIEVAPLPHHRAEKRRQESLRYFGDRHELTSYWTIQTLRAAYENGLTTRSAAAEAMSELNRGLRGAPTSFHDYVRVRTDQWQQQDSRDPLEYAMDGRLLKADIKPTFWSTKSLLAFADELRFLDRHGLCFRARISATAFRESMKKWGEKANELNWLIAFHFSDHDEDWGRSIGELERSLRRHLPSDYSVFPEIRAYLASRYLISTRNLGVKNKFADTRLFNTLASDREYSQQILLNLVTKRAQGGGSNLAHQVDSIISDELLSLTSKVQIATELLPPDFGVSPETRHLARALWTLVTELDSSDLKGIHAAARLAGPLTYYSQNSESRDRFLCSLTNAVDRVEAIASTTSSYRAITAQRRIPATLGFCLGSADFQSPTELRILYDLSIRFREVESRSLRQAIREARKTEEGKKLLQRLFSQQLGLDQLFWEFRESPIPKRIGEISELIDSIEYDEELLLQMFCKPDREINLAKLVEELEPATLLVDVQPFIAFQNYRPIEKQGAFLLHRAENGMINNVSWLEFDQRRRSTQIEVENSSLKRGLEVLKSTPTSLTIEDVLIELIDRSDSPIKQLVLVVDAKIPATQILNASRSSAQFSSNQSLESVCVCFHPCQIEQTARKAKGIGDLSFMANQDYEEFRKSNPSFPFYVPDLEGVSREGNLIRREFERFDVEMNMSRAFTQADDYSDDSVLHIAGHATSLNLRRILQPRAMQHPHLTTLAREMQAWSRVPYVASTLILESDVDSSSLAESSGFLSANAIRYLPVDPPKLVVLSTCDSVDGHSLPTKAPTGLAKAFWIWGVDYIIASTDSVPDDNPSKFLPDFYSQALSGHSLPESFFSAYQSSLDSASKGSSGTNWNFYGY
jgi:CHAT domain-containing protein